MVDIPWRKVTGSAQPRSRPPPGAVGCGRASTWSDRGAGGLGVVVGEDFVVGGIDVAAALLRKLLGQAVHALARDQARDDSGGRMAFVIE